MSGQTPTEGPAAFLAAVPRRVIVVENESERVIFPHLAIPVRFTPAPENRNWREHMLQNSHIMVVAKFGERLFPVGVLGTARNFEQMDETCKFEFLGLARVRFRNMQNEQNATFADWELVSENRKIPPDHLKDVEDEIKEFQDLAVSLLEYAHDRVPDEDAKIFELPFFREGLKKIEKITPKTLGETLDAFMNLLCHIDLASAKIPEKDIFAMSLGILQEGDCITRLVRVNKLLGHMLAQLNTMDAETSETHEEQYKKIKSGLPEEAQKEIERELRRLKRGAHPSEASMIRDHLELLLELPWNTATEDNKDIKAVEKILNEDHAGLEDVKDRILEQVAGWKHNQGRAPILCFIGSPGVGKTSLGKSIARALGRKFNRLSLGGLRDEAVIRGHGGTYINAKAGEIIQKIRKTGSKNPVFMLDEIDKVSNDWRGDPADALLEVLDPEQNKEFFDQYLNVPFDLSQVFFICTANTTETIPEALGDRMEIIEIPGYTPLEKLDIAKKHLVPRQSKQNGFPVMQDNKQALEVAWSNGAIMDLIEKYTQESGVRNLEREIGGVYRAILLKFERGEFASVERIKITAHNLPKYAGNPVFTPGPAFDKMPPGCVPMFAVSASGGHFFYVETKMERGRSQRKIKVTGVRGSGDAKDVMNNLIEESIDIALDSLILEGGLLHEQEKTKRNEGGEYYIHVHVRNGSRPKDGPSAGIPIHWAIYGLLTGQSIQPNLGATGEIDLELGVVGEVGSIRDKALAAAKAKITKFVLPKANEPDLEDIPNSLKSKIEFFPVQYIWEADEIAFPNDPRIRAYAESQRRKLNQSVPETKLEDSQ